MFLLKYLNEMESDRKLSTNDKSAVQKNITQTVTSQLFSGKSNKTRRFRRAFTTEQIQYLENEFKKFPYIGSVHRKDVSTILNIPERAIKIWFQNRRMKEKKEVIDKQAEEEQKKMNISQEQNIKTIHHKSYNQPYTVCRSKLKIYQDPTITKASINVCSSKKFPKPIQDQVTEKSFNMCDKNICTTKVTQEPVGRNLIKVKQENPEENNNQEENPEDLTSKTQCCSQVVQPKYYQISPNQEQYMPLHVPTVHQPRFVQSNILWKPVNMMPVVPGIAAPHQQTHNNGFSLIHSNFRKDCNCNNHNIQQMSPLMEMDGKLHLQSQYVLAMPFNQQFNCI